MQRSLPSPSRFSLFWCCACHGTRRTCIVFSPKIFLLPFHFIIFFQGKTHNGPLFTAINKGPLSKFSSTRMRRALNIIVFLSRAEKYLFKAGYVSEKARFLHTKGGEKGRLIFWIIFILPLLDSTACSLICLKI